MRGGETLKEESMAAARVRLCLGPREEQWGEFTVTAIVEVVWILM